MLNLVRQLRFPAALYLHYAVVAVAVAAPCLYLLGGSVITPTAAINRDAGHYYAPLFQWARSQWGSGEIPLWNPQENGGYPVSADATASLFYPGKMVFALPLSFYRLNACYTLAHLLLAAGGVWLLARRWRVSVAGAGFAAVSYALAGAVSFQYCNVVFLVGAAWFPLALLAADRMYRQRSHFWGLMTGAVLALMTLGGDPQAAYHAGLCIAGYALLVRRMPEPRRASQALTWRRRWLMSRPLLLLTACGALICLAAVQIFPSWQWAAGSHRAAYIHPRNVYEAAAELSRSSTPVAGPVSKRGSKRGSNALARVQTGIFGEPESGTHHDHIYQFSIGPWRACELLWPNFSGRPFPVNRRWASAIPGADRLWTPSLYAGLAPLLLGLGCMRWRGGKAWQRWMTFTLLFAAAGSLGWYGLGWLLHEFRAGVLGANPNNVMTGQPVGGVYWFMVTLLPGYAYFRYPAKLATVATLALALLAGLGFDRARQHRWKWPLQSTIVVSVVSVAGLVAALIARPFWDRIMAHTPVDAFTGPVSSTGSANDLLFSLLHAVLLCVIFGWLFTRKTRGRRWQAALLVITSLELCIAHGWTAPVAPDALWEAKPYAAKVLDAAESSAGSSSASKPRVYRARGAKWLPAAWRRSSSEARQRDGLRWDRATLSPKHHLTTGYCVMTGTHTSITPHDYVALMHAARHFGVKRPDGVMEPSPRVLDFFAAQYRITPESFKFPAGELLPAHHGTPPVHVNIGRSHSSLPRAWVVHAVEALPPLRSPTWVEVERRTVDVWFPHGKLRPFDVVAVVEADAAPECAAAPEPAVSRCRIQSSSATRVVIQADMAAAGIVVLSDRFDPGWKATVASNGQPPVFVRILRTNRVMRGVALPAGSHRLEYRYQPASFRCGALLSIAAWVLLAATIILTRTRPPTAKHVDD